MTSEGRIPKVTNNFTSLQQNHLQNMNYVKSRDDFGLSDGHQHVENTIKINDEYQPRDVNSLRIEDIFTRYDSKKKSISEHDIKKLDTITPDAKIIGNKVDTGKFTYTNNSNKISVLNSSKIKYIPLSNESIMIPHTNFSTVTDNELEIEPFGDKNISPNISYEQSDVVSNGRSIAEVSFQYILNRTKKDLFTIANNISVPIIMIPHILSNRPKKSSTTFNKNKLVPRLNKITESFIILNRTKKDSTTFIKNRFSQPNITESNLILNRAQKDSATISDIKSTPRLTILNLTRKDSTTINDIKSTLTNTTDGDIVLKEKEIMKGDTILKADGTNLLSASHTDTRIRHQLKKLQSMLLEAGLSRPWNNSVTQTSGSGNKFPG